jgi:hypothetical protein
MGISDNHMRQVGNMPRSPTEDAYFAQGDEQAALDTLTTADETSISNWEKPLLQRSWLTGCTA